MLNARLLKSSGAYDNAVERAILKPQPLPRRRTAMFNVFVN